MHQIGTLPPAKAAPAPRILIENAVERLLALLDALDGDTDREDGADAEPSLAAPENSYGSQAGWMRGSDTDCEAA